MAIDLLKSYPQDFDKVFPLFNKVMNVKENDNKFKRLFNNYWQASENHNGYMLVDSGKVVGYLGYLFYERVKNKKIFKFCNIQGWVVEKEYRIQHKMKVMEPVLDMKDYTIIGLNPTKAAYKNEIKLGFKDLEASYYIIPALGNIKYLFDKNIRVYNNSATFTNILSNEDLKIWQDHIRFPRLKYSVIDINGQIIFLVYSIKQKKKLPFAEIYYISNLDFFLNEFKHIRSLLGFKLKIFGFFIDKRFLKNQSYPFMYEYRYAIPNIFMSSILEPHQIDLLYSEKFVLYG